MGEEAFVSMMLRTATDENGNHMVAGSREWAELQARYIWHLGN